MKDLKQKVGSAVKTGKLVLGSKNVIRLLLNGTAKLVILSDNCPKGTKERIIYYCKLSGVSCRIANVNGLELGAACRKPFNVSALAVLEQGDSKILDLAD
jgi:large subunit ribosomal protein L30e